MDIIIRILVVLLITSIVIVAGYFIYMGTKRNQYPDLDFSRFDTKDVDIKAVEQLVYKAMRGVNGWMWLASTFISLHYLLNFWSIVFMLINIVVVSYMDNEHEEIVLMLVLGSLLFTCLELWLNTKEKSIYFHKLWFDTSDVAKEYIVKIATVTTIEDLQKCVIEFNHKIYQENANVKIL